MTLGFIESKADSNLCFKVEGKKISDAPVMCRCTIVLGMEVWQSTGVAECRWNLPWTKEVCSRDPEEVRDD